jgi:hypothetical protein
VKGDRSADYRDKTNESQHVNAIPSVSMVRHLLGSSEAPFAKGNYLLNWPFLRLTGSFQFSKAHLTRPCSHPCVFCRLLH